MASSADGCKNSKMRTAIVLGAGFSHVAGLPLLGHLFDPDANSVVSPVRVDVLRAYEMWSRGRADGTPEDWLAQLYPYRDSPLQRFQYGVTWDEVMQFLLSKLVRLPGGSHAAYYHGITTHQCHSVHREFWRRIESIENARHIVSLNYDILVEQALHTGDGKHRSAPRCRYGGFPYTQVVRKLLDVRGKYELVELGAEFVLYKLHGSINWAFEPHSDSMKIHDDVRAVFRTGAKAGVPAIIPPIPEKEMPPHFSQVWREARSALAASERWIVCGYSLPVYDEALRRFFGSILGQRSMTTVVILDPDAEAVALRWRSLASGVEVVTRPGLPAALETVW
jgi:hypothetical protein